MQKSFDTILQQNSFTKVDLVRMLLAKGEEQDRLFAQAAKIRSQYVGNKVYLRGLIELSNHCRKNCLYCGIRRGNKQTDRYMLPDEAVLQACEFAYKNNFGSIVLQGGELTSKQYVSRIENLLMQIKKLSNNELGITLSLGEQSEETYRHWFEAGAHRYLLRIESSNCELYEKIHPRNIIHDYNRRVACLKLLQKTGYQVGTGVMIGLPFQMPNDLAQDLLFIQSMDIDMVGMGPYIEHKNTPLYQYKDLLLPIEERYWLSLRMVAVLRILTKDINIAAVTALQAIHPEGRNMAIQVGANVIMPNITPGDFRNIYKLYENKPTISQDDEDNIRVLVEQIKSTGNETVFGKWGDSLHFSNKHTI
ncbi:MAG: [FeFe] hydrogenase H-cluster radical SAM maturase HydE [Prevotellaceae bacterium]|jgi:biotin synthase|nr:[FeFe] hydrogenase H-cluster radical SAM maturase HydE [Prevotellaceae bacterium]